MLDLVPRRLMGVAEQLLGAGTLVEPDESPAPDDAPKKSDNGVGIGQHVRGVINVMPELPDAPRVAAAGRCHTDGHPFSLGVVAYLSDVLPGGGSFSVWPRSHRRLFHLQPWQYSSRGPDHSAPPNPAAVSPLPAGPAAALLFDHVSRRRFLSLGLARAQSAEIQAIRDDTHPVECHGRAGTVILWHHRLGHAKGQNLSAAGGAPRIRHAVFYDYIKRPQLFCADGDKCPEEVGPSENGDGPPPSDMWRDWSAATRQAARRQRQGLGGWEVGAARAKL